MDLISIFERLGLPSAVIVLMVWLFMQSNASAKQDRELHRKERKEWQTDYVKIADRSALAIEELTEAIKEENSLNKKKKRKAK